MGPLHLVFVPSDVGPTQQRPKVGVATCSRASASPTWWPPDPNSFLTD